MDNFKTQIQRVKSQAVNEHVFPQLKASLTALNE